MKTGILLMGHGSRIAEANGALDQVAAMVKTQTGAEIVEVAFRELHQPGIQAGIDACVAKGADRILLYPYFLFAGAHVLEDLPDEIEQAKQRHAGLEMILCRPLGVHQKLAEVVCERLDETLAESGWDLKG
jgi:sirohydrochlorin ferrochelatase